jgi:hypothetical protein
MKFDDFIEDGKVKKASPDKSLISSSEKFDRFRKLRNKLNYYGGSISAEEMSEIKVEIKDVIVQLRRKFQI